MIIMYTPTKSDSIFISQDTAFPWHSIYCKIHVHGVVFG